MTALQKYGPWELITGASEGTGRAFAERLAKQGFRLLLVARREAGLADPAEVARAALEQLPHGPAADWGVDDDTPGPGGLSAVQRRERVHLIEQISAAMFKRAE